MKRDKVPLSPSQSGTDSVRGGGAGQALCLPW